MSFDINFKSISFSPISCLYIISSMEIALKIEKRMNWSRDKWFIYLILTFSMLYWFLDIYDMQGYRPWKFRLGRAIADSAFGHCGLWLATIQFRNNWRILIMTILFFNSAGFVLLWGMLHPLAGLIALTGMGRLMYRVITGR
jgi:hypothetical protein